MRLNIHLVLSLLYQVGWYLIPVLAVGSGFVLGHLAKHLEMKEHMHYYGDREMATEIDALRNEVSALKKQVKRAESARDDARAQIRAAILQQARVTEILTLAGQEN